MNWAHKIILDQHGWKKSRDGGGWYREHKKLDKTIRKTEFVGGDTSHYLPRYTREVVKLLKLGFDKFLVESYLKKGSTYTNTLDRVLAQ